MKEIIKHEINGERRWFVLFPKTDRKSFQVTSFSVRPLGENDTDEMCKLSQDVYAYLRKDEKTFIHQHDEAYFRSVFNQKNVHYIGVFHQAKLIAMSYVKICRDEKSFVEEIPSATPPMISADSPVATFGGDCVHPDFRGLGLNQLMVDFRLHQAQKNACLSSYAIIDRHNQWNMPPYFKNDFCMVSSGIDPSDQGKIAVMRHAPHQQVQKSNHRISVPFDRFEQIDALFGKKFVAYAYDSKNQHLIFTRQVPQRIRGHHKSMMLRSANQRGENTHD